MGRVIDESLLQEKLALIPMEERTFRRTVEELENASTVEAIPKADYENRLKADLVAILKEIQLEIEEQSLTHSEDNILSEWGLGYNHSVERCGEIIQQKINKLEGNKQL